MSEIDREVTYNLVMALRSAFISINDEEAARDAYQGQEWGYHGYHFKNKVDEKIDRVTEALLALQTQDQSDKGGMT